MQLLHGVVTIFITFVYIHWCVYKTPMKDNSLIINSYNSFISFDVHGQCLQRYVHFISYSVFRYFTWICMSMMHGLYRSVQYTQSCIYIYIYSLLKHMHPLRIYIDTLNRPGLHMSTLKFITKETLCYLDFVTCTRFDDLNQNDLNSKTILEKYQKWLLMSCPIPKSKRLRRNARPNC